jgi:hypothetical protein
VLLIEVVATRRSPRLPHSLLCLLCLLSLQHRWRRGHGAGGPARLELFRRRRVTGTTDPDPDPDTDTDTHAGGQGRHGVHGRNGDGGGRNGEISIEIDMQVWPTGRNQRLGDESFLRIDRHSANIRLKSQTDVRSQIIAAGRQIEQ